MGLSSKPLVGPSNMERSPRFVKSPPPALKRVRPSISYSSSQVTSHQPPESVSIADFRGGAEPPSDITSTFEVCNAAADGPAYQSVPLVRRLTTPNHEKPRSVADDDLFSTHEARVAYETRQYLPRAPAPLFVYYKDPVPEERASPTQCQISAPVDFAGAPPIPPKSSKRGALSKAKPHPSTRAEQTLEDTTPATPRKAPKALGRIQEAEVIKPSNRTDKQDIESPSETTVDTTILESLNLPHESAPTERHAIAPKESKNDRRGGCSLLVSATQRLRKIRLHRSPSLTTLSSLTALREICSAQQNNTQSQEEEEYEKEKLALYNALNIGRENKDSIQSRRDKRRQVKCEMMLPLLQSERDSDWEQILRLEDELEKIESRRGQRSEKLKLDKGLDDDARVAAAGQDLQCLAYKKRAHGATSSRPAAIISDSESNVAIPSHMSVRSARDAHVATDIQYLEKTGRIQLIGPPKYGGLATGTLWTDGGYSKYGEGRAEDMFAQLSDIAEEDSVSQTHVCYDAVTDESYKYIGIARTRKEKKWVIHLSKEGTSPLAQERIRNAAQNPHAAKTFPEPQTPTAIPQEAITEEDIIDEYLTDSLASTSLDNSTKAHLEKSAQVTKMSRNFTIRRKPIPPPPLASTGEPPALPPARPLPPVPEENPLWSRPVLYLPESDRAIFI